MAVFDLFILGGGSAGFAAAGVARRGGMRVGMAEMEPVVGGTCVNRGCIPSKNLVEAARLVHEARHNRFPGLRFDVSIDFATLIKQKAEVVDLDRAHGFERYLSKHPDIRLYGGQARFLDSNTVGVDGQRVTAKNFLIATGARPAVPKILGIDEVDYLTSREALSLRRLPQSMVAITGGYGPMEIPQVLSRLGTRVTILERDTSMMRMAEPEIPPLLAHYFREEGIEIFLGVHDEEVTQTQDGVSVSFEVDGKTYEAEGEQLYVDTARSPNTDDMGLEEVGVRTRKRGFVKVDSEMRTSVSNIWAAGDVIGGMMTTPASIIEGRLAARNIMGEGESIDYGVVPSAFYTDPEVAMVGIREQAARESGLNVESRVLPMTHVNRARTVHDTRGVIKMVIDRDTREILGVQILGPMAADIINHASCLIRSGATVEEVAREYFTFPTRSEALQNVAEAFYKPPRLIPA